MAPLPEVHALQRQGEGAGHGDGLAPGQGHHDPVVTAVHRRPGGGGDEGQPAHEGLPWGGVLEGERGGDRGVVPAQFEMEVRESLAALP